MPYRRLAQTLALFAALFLASAIECGNATLTLSLPVQIVAAPTGACVLGNHGNVRGRPIVTAAGTILADDGCLLRGVGSSASYFGPANLTWYQNAVNTFHFNAMRVSTCLSACNGGTETLAADEADIDDQIAQASQVGTYIVIDFHNGGEGSFPACVWDDDTTFWTAIAPRYAANTNVMYQIQNEPDNCQPLDYPGIASQMDRLYQLIRGAAPSTPILVWTFLNPSWVYSFGPGLPAELNAAPDISYANAAVDFHNYSGGYQGFATDARAHPAPVIMSEEGPCDSNTNGNWATDIQNLEAINISWFGLCALPNTGGDPNLNVFWPKD